MTKALVKHGASASVKKETGKKEAEGVESRQCVHVVSSKAREVPMLDEDVPSY